MNQTNLGILDAIEVAMEAERKANDFYRNAKDKVTTATGKNLLQQLADFEQTHYDKLNELKTKLSTEGKFIEYEGTQFQNFKSDIPSEASGTIETNKNEVLQVLKLAIDAEAKAAANYRKLEAKTDNPKGKDMFHKLAEEEILHRRILSDEFYQMSNMRDVWAWGD